MSSSTTAALLASRAFGRIHWLGAPKPVHVREALMINVDRAPHELARAVRGRILGTVPPNFASEIQSVLNQCAYDPLRLAILAADGPPEIVSHLVPHELIGTFAKSAASKAIDANLRLADAHLHSGASMGLDVFLRTLGRSAHPAAIALFNVYAHDDVGDEYSIGAVVGGIRHFLRLLYAEQTGKRIETPPKIMASWKSGEFWSYVGSIASSAGGEPLHRPIGDMYDLCAIPIVIGGIYGWDPSADARKYIAEVLNSGTIDERHLCTGLVGALFLLNAFLKSSPGEGLPSFVDRFEQMGLLRDSALTAERADAVGLAVDFVLEDSRVVGAEFRKSVYADSASTLSSLEANISRSLADHLTGFSQSTAVLRKPRNLSMPVTFLRGKRNPERDDVALIYDLEPLWRLAIAIENVASRNTAGQFISAVDIVGNELSMPNWVFMPLLHYFGGVAANGGSAKYVRSCHAGEAFAIRLQGIRSVGELVTPARLVDRIGHGLALDALAADFIVGNCPTDVTARAVIEDMCWLAAAGMYVGEAKSLLNQVIGALNLTTLGITPENLVEAWLERCAIKGYKDNGLCGGLNQPPKGVYPLNARFARGKALAFLLLTHHSHSFPFNALDASLQATLAAAYVQLDKLIAEPVASHVRDLIKAEKIVIEACPSSNMRLAGLPKVSYLPLEKWLNEGLRVSINSDDPLIFGNSVIGEAALVLASCADWVLPRLAETAEEACGIGRFATGRSSYVSAAEIASSAANIG